MNSYTKPLNEEGWSEHYNVESLGAVVESIKIGNVQVWAKELEKICSPGAECLEIGCGTGISSLWLAQSGRKVTALDYTESSVQLVREAARQLGISNINVVKCDATKDLPFEKKQFDYAFQAGLLEHFETHKQIELLKSWAKYSKYMISMIPNSASIPYRVGKQIMEDSGVWKYGLEIPKHSLKEEFTKAGIEVEREYTIGTEWAYGFLPDRHYIRQFFDKLMKDGYDLDKYMQGYLLVTVGKCID